MHAAAWLSFHRSAYLYCMVKDAQQEVNHLQTGSITSLLLLGVDAAAADSTATTAFAAAVAASVLLVLFMLLMC